ncbi:allophanate hydrolase [Marinibaculum pumilum]|uniref:Allophanate hydrolase n=1 Tax=Marinibaculum pumilum TaxID=1766165 RepID=A0ABV7L850_9PROT
MTDLPFDIGSLHDAYAGGLTPRQVVETALARLAAADDPGIFIHLADRDALLAQADALGGFDPARLAAMPLWGIPCAVKDNIDVAGMPTTAACPDYAYLPERDSTAVARLRAAGALVLGKTNLDQFATGLVGLRSPYPIPRNAVDPALVPGGSSSGSAVAVARGIASFALGTDTAGSGRIPAGLNNIVGLKPTVGAISAAGVVPACRTLDCVSVFALTVDDAWAAFAAMAAADPADPYSKSVAVPAAPARPAALTVGVPAPADQRFFGDGDMGACYAAALEALAGLGCRVVELPFADFYATADLLYEGAWVAERYAAIDGFIADHEDALHPVTRTIIGGARKLSAVDAFKGLYALQGYRAKLAPVLASVDLLCLPTAPTHYTVAEVEAEPIATNSRLGTYTNFVNLLDMCGMAVPAGSRADGRPFSLTLLAPAGQDALCAGLARDIHRAGGCTLGGTDWAQPDGAIPAGADPAAGEQIELVVFGAHLSGMPLNGELRRLGASFARTVRTAPSYRLYALAGQKVARPGLVRTDGPCGDGIEGEVWRLSPAAFGTFVAAIAPPLGIGTVDLDDGSQAKGFIAEPAGLGAAQDITRYGGWRGFAADIGLYG